MSAMQRNKGRRGENEVAQILREELGIKVNRNWISQAAESGHGDLIGIDGYSLEVKRAKSFREDWWQQTLDQASRESKIPVLVYRLDGYGRGKPNTEKWRCKLPLKAICKEDVDLDHIATISLGALIQILREQM